MDGYWIWDGSIIQDDQGTWHMFASRWSKDYPMHPGWLFRSEIVRATADKAEGPYTFQEVIFENRDPNYFDGRMTHNPAIRKIGDTYALFYIGNSYMHDLPDEDPILQGEDPNWFHNPWTREISTHMRSGVATSKSLEGPWARPDEPLLDPAPNAWDKGTIVNPAPCVMDDGSIYMAYASSHLIGQKDSASSNIGIARAEALGRPFERVSGLPCFSMKETNFWFEDPFLWHADGHFHLIMKDLTGTIASEAGRGVYAFSENAIDWHWGSPAECYEKSIPREDGSESVGNFERPSLYFDTSGRKSYMTAASASSNGHLNAVTDTWVNVIPLR